MRTIRPYIRSGICALVLISTLSLPIPGAAINPAGTSHFWESQYLRAAAEADRSDFQNAKLRLMAALSLVGNDVERRILTLELLADVCSEMDDLVGEENALTAYIATLKSAYGVHNEQTATAFNLLSFNYTKRCNYPSAEYWARQALDSLRKIPSSNAVLRGSTMNNLAWLLYKQHKLTEAESLYIEALNVLLAEGSNELAGFTANNLANIYEDTNQIEKAIKYYWLAVRMLTGITDGLEVRDRARERIEQLKIELQNRKHERILPPSLYPGTC